jgi:hypothetical protein
MHSDETYGNPELRLALNEDLVIEKKGPGQYGSVSVDDMNFNDCVNVRNSNHRGLFLLYSTGRRIRCLELPPHEFSAPFASFRRLKKWNKLEITILIRAEIQQPLWCQCCGGNAHACSSVLQSQ